MQQPSNRQWIWCTFVGLLSLCYVHVFAQENLLNCSDSTFCVPSVSGMPRSKGIILEYERVVDYGIKAKSSNPVIGEVEDGGIRVNRQIQFVCRLPLYNKEHLKIAAGVRYFTEEFRFDNTEYPLFQSLEERPLKSIGLSAYIVKSFRGNKFFLLKLGADLNGDYNQDIAPNSTFLRYSAVPLFGWKRNEQIAYGLGIAYSYVFGNPRFIPVFAYNNTFNRKWGLEMLLPGSIRLRHNMTEKDIFYLTTKINGASYRISLENDTAFSKYDILDLKKSEIRAFATYEREIYDFVWFGVNAGLRKNLSFDLTDSLTGGGETIIEGDVRRAFFFNVSLFLVPPRKLLE
ncbi:MAG: DUF6268 family outer membrane beta-barrel protein [Chitinophagales bacterium]